MKTSDFKNDEEYQFLERFKTIYTNLKGNGFSDFEPYRSLFLTPFMTELFQKVTNEIDINELIIPIANVLTRLNNVELNNISHANVFADFKENKSIEVALKYFEEVIEKVGKINEP